LSSPSLIASLLASKFPASAPYAATLLPLMAEHDITTPLRQAHFIAQIAVESAGFTRVRESLNYSIEGLLDTFGRHRISFDDATLYGRSPAHPANPEAIANRVYGGDWGKKNLGNTVKGDGYRFIGRGLKQVTGRANYRACSRELFGDDRLLEHPETLEQPPAAARSAVWFWLANNCNRWADADNVSVLTQVVNGGTNGLQKRLDYTRELKAALQH